MPITLGSNTITGVSAGGYDSGVFTSGNFASATINRDKLASNALVQYVVGQRNSDISLGGDSGWNDYFSFTFSVSYSCRIMVLGFWGCSWESGPGQTYERFLINGSKIGWNTCIGRQTTANTAAGASSHAYGDVAAGTHTVMMQVRNVAGGSTWRSVNWTADGESAATMAVACYF
jgi:hypothetical protein